MKILILLSLLIMTLATGGTGNEDPREIIRLMDEQMRGDASYAEMAMTIERPRYTRDISMRSWALGERYSLIVITSPARERGTAFLKRGNEIWNYQPNVDRTIRMPSSMMAQSWMGSDFTNDDLVRETSLVNDFDHALVGTELIGDRDCYIIDMIPKEGATIVFDRVRIWVSKDDYLQLRVENYDQRDRLVNTIVMSDIREIGGRVLPTRLELIPEDNPGHKTVMQYLNADFSPDLDEEFFSQHNLRRLQ